MDHDQTRGEAGAIQLECIKEAQRLLRGADYYLRGEESAVESLLMKTHDSKSGVTMSMVENAVQQARDLWDGNVNSSRSVAAINQIRQLDALAREGLLKPGADRRRRESVMQQYPTEISTPAAG